MLNNFTLRYMLAILSFFILSGCGDIKTPLIGGASGSNLKVQPQGMYVDMSTESFLREKFDELKLCANFKSGNFDDLSIVFMPPRFPCRWYESGCGGEFTAPNSIKISNHYYWKHELIHYMLYLNTGDPDSNHESGLYEECA